MQNLSRNAWESLLAGEPHWLPLSEAHYRPTVLFPGAFNPLHDGHLRMAQLAAERSDGELAFELSIQNVEKRPLDFAEVARRLSQFRGERLVLTSAATFVEKSRLFPRTTFVVGIDTLLRIGDPRFYDDSHVAMSEAIETISQQGCRFLVFGRLVDDNFQILRDFAIAPALAAICQGFSEPQFRVDVSSTELRDPS